MPFGIRGGCTASITRRVRELQDSLARRAELSYHGSRASMADFDIRADSVDVHSVLEQIRARLREKRGVDYTEQQIRELAAVKLERFLDPKAVRSDLLKEFRAAKPPHLFEPFGPDPLFSARRPIVARIRRWLHPVLRLFINPDPIAEACGRINQLATI